MLWFHLAAQLHQPVQVVQALTTSTEFNKWQDYFRLERSFFHREDYYFAQIAAEIRRGNVRSKDAKRVKVRDFLIEFLMSRKTKKGDKTWQEKMKASKSYMFRKLGMKTKELK